MSDKSNESILRKVIRNGVGAHHRTMFVIVGKKSRNQVIKLYNMLTETRANLKLSVLWCCKNSNNRKTKNEETLPSKIRYVSYKDSQKILGNTFSMCILEDFESLTPNIMARTIETVSGGGLIILLLPTISSLKSLYKYPMEIHRKLLTKSCQPNHRFNERFVLSLGTCRGCFVIDDNLTILPISAKNIHRKRSIEDVDNEDDEFKNLREQIRNIPSVGELLETCKTLDQAKAVLKLIDCITEKTPRSTVSLTSSRGRGKSAALGLAVAAGINFKLSNIFVTSPHPDNLKTFFQFVLKGFDALHYREGVDYCLIQSTNPEFHGAIVRINVFRDHRQTVQYVHPTDNRYITQAELVVIDEAAAIPIPFVRAMLGPHLVFMASTIDGYEGTGRSLSLKLIKSLQCNQNTVVDSTSGAGGSVSNRSVQELTMDEPIRYKSGDEIEAWLTKLLCLDSKTSQSSSICPPLDGCELYYVNRDTLFSYNKTSEEFLQRIMSLFVTSHYKNTPNDLQIMADASSHHLFCLLGPISEGKASLPEVLVAVQVCLEGKLPRDHVEKSLSKGVKASGDLIPWIIAEQHQDPAFAAASGARIVRIATNPAYQRMNYGTRAVQLLQDYYEYKILSIDEEVIEAKNDDHDNDAHDEMIADLQSEVIEPRKTLSPLLVKLSERKPEDIRYLGVAYGLTEDLLRFWQRCQFYPVYLRQTSNDLTGEHSCIMIKELNGDKSRYAINFKTKFINLLAYQFKKFPSPLALSIIKSRFESLESPDRNELTRRELDSHFTKYDLKKLDSYAKNLLDYHLIMNVVPSFARLFFLNRMGNVELSPVQSVILLGLGLQNKSVDSLAKELDLPSTQLIALFNRTVKKFVQFLDSVLERDIEKSLPLQKEVVMVATKQGLQDELDEAEQEMKRKQKKELEKMKLEHLVQFSIKGSEDEWTRGLSGTGKKSVVSIKSGEKRLFDDKESLESRSLEVDPGNNRKRKKKK